MAGDRNSVKGYHRYVFDAGERRFVGAFEDMYRAEQAEGFDSWHQEDQRDLGRRVALDILGQWNFQRVLDLGCGKGAFTHQVWRHESDAVGVDVSETALAVARARYPDIRFVQADVRDPSFDLRTLGAPFDLAVCMETLSYVERWRELIEQIARAARLALIGLYIPDNPIGYVKSFDDLTGAFARSFEIVEEVRLVSRKKIVLFGRTRSAAL